MNKTIIINISGVIFHIEENAYEILKNYMNDINHHFANFQDNHEIISDIENRIAEMFTEILSIGEKPVIIAEDVELVISKMGTTADFIEEGEEDTTEPLGEHQFKRKLFRDIDDRVIGGVCSGIGHYFEIEPRWIRIASFILFLTYGIGFIPYIILWMVMPKANSRTEKMEMKGEIITLQSFQKNLKDELTAVKSNFDKVHQSSKPGLGRLGSFIRAIFDGIFKFIGTTGRFILKVLGIILIIFVGIILIGAFVALLIFLGNAGNTEVSTIFPLNALAASLRPAVYISAFVVIFIPLVAIILYAVRIIFNNKTMNKTIGFNMLMIWIIALGIVIYCIARNATDFKENASYSKTIPLMQNSNGELFIQMAAQRTIQENIVGGNEDRIITVTGSDRDFDMPDNVYIDLKLIQKGQPFLIKTYTASGKNFDQALNNAHKIDYYYSKRDSLLIFDNQFGLKENSLWRGQEVNLTLNIPIGSTIYIQKKFAKKFLRNLMYECLDWNDESNDYVKVSATIDGFSCKKSDRVIEEQKERNLENNNSDPVLENLIFQ